MIKNRFLLNSVIAIFISFLASSFLIKNLFLANSPKVNPYFADNLKIKIKNNLAFLNFFNNQKDNQNLVQQKKQEIFKEISQGVRAAETDQGTIVNIDYSKIDWVTYTFNLNGKEIKIDVPKDQDPPTQQQVEDVYGQ